MMPRKPKTPQKEDLEGVSGRDQFQTPNYAVDLLVPYLKSLKIMLEQHFELLTFLKINILFSPVVLRCMGIMMVQ